MHPVALAFGAIAFIMGIIAHCSAVCCLDVIFANLAAGSALIAFGLDCALFIIAKKRIENINGASASLGTARECFFLLQFAHALFFLIDPL